MSCIFCGTIEAKFRCSKCKEHYCSKECQRADWEKHSRVCFEVGTTRETPKTRHIKEYGPTSGTNGIFIGHESTPCADPENVWIGEQHRGSHTIGQDTSREKGTFIGHEPVRPNPSFIRVGYGMAGDMFGNTIRYHTINNTPRSIICIDSQVHIVRVLASVRILALI